MSTKLTKKTIVALASMMLACFVSVAAENPYTVQYTVTGYAGTEALTNFPVLVRLAANSPVGFAYADCVEGGADLTFTDDEGNAIPREIDTWNTAGESLVWVCVPVLTNGVSFTMHYGNPFVTAQPACQTDGSVWSGANFKGVWHMDSVDPTDSSPNGYNGTHQTGNLSVTNGPLGAAVNFPRTTTGDGISCGSVIANSELTGGFTIEGWCRPTQYGDMGDGAAMFGKTGFVSLRIHSATNVVLTTPGKINHDIGLEPGVLPAVNEWWHFVATFKMNTANTGLKFYLNGQLVKTQGAGDINDKTSASALFLGNNQWNQAFKGDLDEIRLSAGLRSADWIAASYATQHATDFLTATSRTGGETPFLTNIIATPAYTNAQVSVGLATVGEGATSATVTFVYGPEGGALSEPIVLAAAATNGWMMATNLTDLATGTAYRYVFTAENNLPSPLSQTVEGTFSTRVLSAPTISLSDRQEDAESQLVDVTVTELGGGSSCDLYFAYAPDDGTPLAYTQVGTDLAAGATFSRLLDGLDVNTVYVYSFAVTNDLELGTVVTGTFVAGAGYLNPTHFSYSANFTVNGYEGTEVLTNFPVLVRLAANSPVGFDYADSAAGGPDIRFTDAEGNLIPHEIDTWDTAGESLIWVGLPIATNGTAFTMYYHSDAPGLPSTDDVWADYVAVVHGGASIANSVSGGQVATAGSASVAANMNAGKIGGGIRKSTSESIGVNIATPSAKLSDNGKFSVSAWFKRAGNGGNNNGTHILAASRPGWNNGAGYLWLQQAGKYISVAAPNSHQFSSGNYTLPDDAWAHAAFSYNKNVSLTTYFNGVQDNQKTSSIGNLVGTADTWTFGSYQNTASKDSLVGDMDELRIYNGVASGDRIKAEYATMASGDFLTVGPSSASQNPMFSTASLLAGFDIVNVSATVDSAGEGASSCDLYFAYAPARGELPNWTLVASDLTEGASHICSLSGLVQNADYHYAFMASNNLEKITVRTGTFTAGAGYLNYTKFSYNAKFTVSGYAGTEVLTNFPVLVRLAANSPVMFDYADCASGGADIRFADAAGKLIVHEVDTWNTAGESLVWVSLPIVTNGTSFTMYYCAADVSALPVVTVADVWTNANYNAVWHFSGDAKESANGLTVSDFAGTPDYTATTFGVGSAFKASGDATIGYDVDAKWTTLGSGNTLTVSTWAKYDSSTPGCARMLSSMSAWTNLAGWELTIQNKVDEITVGSSGKSQYQYVATGVGPGSGNVYLTAVYNANKTVQLYVNGALVESKVLNQVVTPTEKLWIASCNKSSNRWNGKLDEMRIHRDAESADWVKACYDTMSSSAFLTVGQSSAIVKPILSASTLLVDSAAVNVSATVDSVGEGASSCDLYFAYAPAGDPLPAWTLVASDLATGASRTRNLTGLTDGEHYDYAFMASNNLEKTVVKSGTFKAGVGFPRPDKNVAEFSRGVKFTVTGYTGTQELTNFPVLVRLAAGSPSGFSYADFYNPGDVQGADLCFLDAAGNGIPYEIDTWNPNGESLVWVTLPRMVNGTEFSMWYRSSKNGSVICADNAWEDYTGVWHLGEGGDGVQSVYDSTTNALTGETHANSLAVAEGRIGAARRNSTKSGNSAANGRILVDLSDAAKRAAVDALAAADSDKTFTASLWMRPKSGTDYCYMISRKEDDYYTAWGVQFNNKNTEYFTSLRVYSAGNHYNQSIAFNVASTAQNTWRKIDIVWSGTTYAVYYDGGAQKYTGALYDNQPALNGSSDLAFGGCTAAGYGSFNGELDEIRLRKGANSTDWVKADYETVTNHAFVTGGAVVSLAETPRPIATLGLADSGARYVQFHGSIGNCGGDATACDFYAKVWKTAEVIVISL